MQLTKQDQICSQEKIELWEVVQLGTELCRQPFPVSPQPSRVASGLVVCASRSGCPPSATTPSVPSPLCSKSTPKTALAISFLPELECLQNQVILPLLDTFSLDYIRPAQ